MGHCNTDDVLKLEKVVNGMNITSKEKFDCEICIKGKMLNFQSREPDVRASAPFEFVHTDLNGPIDPIAKDGLKYAQLFVDDYTGTYMVYFLKNKNDTIKATEKFLADISPFAVVKRLRSDNATEFTNESFENLLIKNKIKHEFSAPYSPHQNGTAE
jgi:transposase InsO family protein